PPLEQWPGFLLDGPDFNYPSRMNFAAELVDTTAMSGHSDRAAMSRRQDEQQNTMSYAELQALTYRITRVLTEDMGLVPGNRLLLRGTNNPMMAASWLAAIKAGLVTVPTMPLLRSKELKQITDKAQVTAMLCDAQSR